MIRILHVLNDLSVGGTAHRVHTLALGLDPARYEVWALTLRDAPTGSVSWPERRLVSFSLDPGVQFGAVRRAARVIREKAIHIVHTHNAGPLLYGGLATRLATKAVLVHGAHGRNATELHGIPRPRQMLLAGLARLSARVVAVNDAIADEVIRSWRLRASQVLTIPNGVDLARFTPRPIRDQNGILVIGTVTRFDRIKNLTLLLQAFECLRRTQPRLAARLLLVGSGPQWAEVSAIAARSAFATDVMLPGETTRPEEWYARFDVFVNCSLSEGMSNAILEAMASGLPVVASNIEGNRSWLRAGDNALFFSPDDPNELASQLTALAHDAERRRALGGANRLLVESRYGSEAFVRCYDTLYQQLVTR